MIPPAAIGAMSSNRVILGQLLSSRARLRFPGHAQPATAASVRQRNPSERHTGTSQTVSLQGVTSDLPDEDAPYTEMAQNLIWVYRDRADGQ